MSRRITIVLSCGTLALGGGVVAGCGKDTNANDTADTTGSATTTTARERTTTGRTTKTTPRKSRTVPTPRGKATTTGKKAPKPTKKAKAPKAKVLETATLVVVAKNNKFAPARLQAKVGQPITWLNQDAAEHNVVAVSGAGFRSPNLKKNASYTFTPRKVGPIDYVCTIHPGQRGRIVVVRG